MENISALVFAAMFQLGALLWGCKFAQANFAPSKSAQKIEQLQSSVDGLTNRLNYIDRRQLDLISMHSVLVKDLAKRGLIRVGQEADEPTEDNLPLNEQER